MNNAMHQQDRGFFLAFEGPEGSGKSTQIAALKKRFSAVGIVPLTTREPGGTHTGDAIRQLLLDDAYIMTPTTEFLLYSASRAEHVETVILPALAQNRLVICDRFAASSLAYQGYGRGLPQTQIATITDSIVPRQPDLTLLLDLDVNVGFERIAARGALDRLEQADMLFHQRVRKGYLEQASKHPDTWLKVDANQDTDALTNELYEILYPEVRAKLET